METLKEQLRKDPPISAKRLHDQGPTGQLQKKLNVQTGVKDYQTWRCLMGMFRLYYPTGLRPFENSIQSCDKHAFTRDCNRRERLLDPQSSDYVSPEDQIKAAMQADYQYVDKNQRHWRQLQDAGRAFPNWWGTSPPAGARRRGGGKVTLLFRPEYRFLKIVDFTGSRFFPNVKGSFTSGSDKGYRAPAAAGWATGSAAGDWAAVPAAGMASCAARPGALLQWAAALLTLPAVARGMIFTPSPDEAGHMRSNWDNWSVRPPRIRGLRGAVPSP
eukprot:SAG31_NODE_5955_length_2243_cov_1.862873_1_plen_273_part_00